MPEAIVFFPQHCVTANGFDRAVIDLVDASKSALVLKSAFFDDALAGDVFFPGADHHDIEQAYSNPYAMTRFAASVMRPWLQNSSAREYPSSRLRTPGRSLLFGQSDTADDPAASLLDNSPHATFAKNGFDDFS